eukprot:1046439-Pyramimonas_sp.AAC.1
MITVAQVKSNGDLVATWPDGYEWTIPSDAQPDEQRKAKAGPCQLYKSPDGVITVVTVNHTSKRPWLQILSKAAGESRKQVCQLVGDFEKSKGEELMKVWAEKYWHKSLTKEEIEDQKKAFLDRERKAAKMAAAAAEAAAAGDRAASAPEMAKEVQAAQHQPAMKRPAAAAASAKEEATPTPKKPLQEKVPQPVAAAATMPVATGTVTDSEGPGKRVREDTPSPKESSFADTSTQPKKAKLQSEPMASEYQDSQHASEYTLENVADWPTPAFDQHGKFSDVRAACFKTGQIPTAVGPLADSVLGRLL